MTKSTNFYIERLLVYTIVLFILLVIVLQTDYQAIAIIPIVILYLLIIGVKIVIPSILNNKK